MIKPLHYDEANAASLLTSDHENKNHNLTQYDREKLQMKIEEMKQEINQHNKLMAFQEEETNSGERRVENEED